MTKKKSLSPLRVLGRTLFFLFWTLLLVVALLLGLIWVLEKGPSPTVTDLFCRSVRESSALKWVANIYLTDEEVAALQSTDEAAAETEPVNVSLIHVAAAAGTPEAEAAATAAQEETPYLQVIDIKGGTYRGKLMIVRDPRSVIVGTSDNLGRQGGLQLTDMVAKYDGIAGVNGGGFNDENGLGDGGTPQGLVITNGQIVYGGPAGTYSVVGLDKDGILIIGKMTGQQALDAGIVWAVSFNMEGAINGALVVNGEIQSYNLASGVNPRTAIGQREDGAILLLVLDGRSVSTLGATLQDVCDVMLEYGAVNVGNLDGGSSSVMVYDGEIINTCASVTGPRYIPDGFIVLKEGSYGE